MNRQVLNTHMTFGNLFIFYSFSIKNYHVKYFSFRCLGFLLLHCCTLNDPFESLSRIGHFVHWTNKPEIPTKFSKELCSLYERFFFNLVQSNNLN